MCGMFEGIVIDNGYGFDVTSVNMDGNSLRGMGLLGMQERVTQCSGQLDIRSQPGMGTQVTIRIPLNGDKLCG